MIIDAPFSQGKISEPLAAFEEQTKLTEGW